MKKRLTCNVPQAHKRILEAHRLWHQALTCYFDPEGFRTNVNASIQALRNVTFAIQNEKQMIDNYDTWYSEWQTRLKKDKIMRWLCDARTDIVHKKDFEMHSTATVTIRCYETILKATLIIPPFLSWKAILKYLAKENVINNELRNLDAYAIIERRWVINDFPEYDVLSLIAYSIGQLFLMVQEAHASKAIDISLCSAVDTIHQICLDENAMPTCMNFTEQVMQETIGIKDFIRRELSVAKIEPNIKTEKRSLRRYGKIFNDHFICNRENPFQYGECLFQIAKQILQKDGYHINLVLIQNLDYKWTMISPIFEDQVSKYIYFSNLAKKVREENIIAIIFIGECWVGTLDVLENSGLRASEQPDRKEALFVDVFTSDMQGKSYGSIFHKNILGKLVFDEDTTDDDLDMTIGYNGSVI